MDLTRLVKVTDVYGDVHYVNPDVVIQISSRVPCSKDEDELKDAVSVIAYRGYYVDHLYMPIPAEEVAKMFGFREKT